MTFALRWKRLHPNAISPRRAHPTDAGLDLSALERTLVGDLALVRTGIAVEIPKGYYGLLCLRSSLGLRWFSIPHGHGVIDTGYRGEIKVPLRFVVGQGWINNPIYCRQVVVEAGERIAQLVIAPVVLCDVEEVEELSDSPRGTGGFGSTGGGV